MRPLVVAALCLGLASPARGQSLAEAARREQDKKKPGPPTARVYTEADLKGSAPARIADDEARGYEDRVEVVFVSGIPVQQRVRVKVETAGLRAARQALADLEDELRRSGGLPGWGR